MQPQEPGAGGGAPGILSGLRPGRGGHVYADRDGVAIECQAFPDSPNRRSFPSAVLRPDDIYQQTIVYKFEVQ